MPALAYRPRSPERTALHRVIRERLATFLAASDGAPAFVREEFEGFLRCGVLSEGFARLRCTTCGVERLVALSCKGRG